MKKPDKFERMVQNSSTWASFMKGKRVLDTDHVIKLLRRQHAAYVRMVNEEYRKWEAITLDRSHGNGRIVMAHYKAVEARDILMKFANYKR